MKGIRLAAALLLSSGAAHAIPTTWELLNEDMTVMGTFMLDIPNQTTSNAGISGDLGFYTVSSWTFLNSPGTVGPYTVNNYMQFFSTVTGQVFRTDFGGGEYSVLRVNDSAIAFGTPGGVLVPGGGLYEAFISETFNYDETFVTCAYYSEIYDPDLDDYIEGPCAFFDQQTDFNIETGYWYAGFLRSMPTTTEVPLPATCWLIAAGVAGLAGTTRKSAPGRTTST